MSDDIAATAPGARGRGRPSVIDPEAIAETAIALWRERGYRSTGWKDIATATGVSIRTLMRHFGTRADIAWIGVGGAAQRLAVSLAAVPPTVPMGDAIRQAVVDSVTRSEQIFRAAPDWLAVVASEPELLVAAPRAYAPWTGALAMFIAHRNPDAPLVVCRALAAAYQAAAFTALAEWAEDGAHEDPDRAVDRMLRWLDVHAPAVTDGGEPEPGAARGDRTDTRTQEDPS